MKSAKTTILEGGWKLTDELRAWARFKTPSVDVELENEKFIDHWLGNGKRMCDWDATFRNWLRRAPEFARQYRNPRPMAAVEMPYERGERTPGAPVQLRDHPLFRGMKK